MDPADLADDPPTRTRLHLRLARQALDAADQAVDRIDACLHAIGRAERDLRAARAVINGRAGPAPSGYRHERSALHDAYAELDRTHPHGGDSWADARRAARRRHLLSAAGGLVDDDLDPDTHRIVDWLAGWDDDTIAGVAALLQASPGPLLRRSDDLS